jgi:hypothetical protein
MQPSTSRFPWSVATLYVVCSLVGAYAASFYYFPHPFLITENFIIADLRYAGALIGAALAAAACAFKSGRTRFHTSSAFPWLVLPLVCCLMFLIYLLCKDSWMCGSVTLLLLFAPWLAVAVNGRLKRSAGAERIMVKSKEVDVTVPRNP